MDSKIHFSGQLACADYLRQLLLKPGPYHAAWEQHVMRPRDGVINQLAVAEVLANHMRSEPQYAGDGQRAAYQLREIVSGALSGRQLSVEIVETFASAFSFAAHEVERLRQLLVGSARISVLAGSHAVPVGAQLDVAKALGPKRHQTLSLHDHLYVGADGRIDRGRTLQVIEATADGVDRVPFLCDTSVLTFEVGQGCVEIGNVAQIGTSVFAAHILLAKVLGVGDTLTLEYWVTYRMPGDLADPSEREFRRAVIRDLRNIDMRVEFHPERLPTKVWWTQWDGIEGAVLNEELVERDSQNSVHRYLRSLDRTVAGFRWTWD